MGLGDGIGAVVGGQSPSPDVSGGCGREPATRLQGHACRLTASAFPPNGSATPAPGSRGRGPKGISFPGRYQECIDNVVEVIRAIAAFEPVHINVPNIDYEDIVRARLAYRKLPMRRIRFHHIRTNECWTRDHGPAFVLRTRRGRTDAAIVDWGYNAWGGKYPPFDADDAVPSAVGASWACRYFIPAS